MFLLSDQESDPVGAEEGGNDGEEAKTSKISRGGVSRGTTQGGLSSLPETELVEDIPLDDEEAWVHTRRRYYIIYPCRCMCHIFIITDSNIVYANYRESFPLSRYQAAFLSTGHWYGNTILILLFIYKIFHK